MSAKTEDWDEVLIKLVKLHKNNIKNCNKENIIQFCLKKNVRNSAQDFLNNFEKSDLKDSNRALKKKEEGNEKYKKKHFEESLLLYTESIFQAPENDVCLPLAYSNRSLVLEQMGYLSESIDDIDMALSYRYPREKVENLILRKARCLIQLGDVEKARKILTEALKNCQKKEYHKLIENEIKKIKDLKNKKISSPKNELPEFVDGENENFPYASKKLSVYYEKNKGRHVIANQDIEIGDLLFVEKPFAFVCRTKKCFNCCKNLIAPIPCQKCTDAYYCSTKCRDDFWKSTHSFECGFSELFKTIGIAHLSLRVILAASCSLDELKQIINGICTPKYENGSIVYIRKGYESVYNLVHHYALYKTIQIFQFAMTALLLALYMKKHTNYFPIVSDEEDLNFLTSLILLHILQSVCNGYAFSDISKKDSKECLEYWTCVNTGTAIYPSASMMNHSCYPSATFDFRKNYIIIRSTKALKKGEEVFISYEPHVNKMKKAKRQEILMKRYFFKCECEPCLQKFDLQDKLTAFKCSSCKGPSVPIEETSQDTICCSCGQNSKVTLEMAKKHNKFYSLMEEGNGLLDDDVNLALKKLLEAWWIGREIFYKFHRDLAYVADGITCCLMKLKDYRRSILFLRCCVRSIEERYGLLCFQYVHDLQKLADLITIYAMNNENENEKSDLVQEGLDYYKKLQRIFRIIPEINECEDLEINMGILEHLKSK